MNRKNRKKNCGMAFLFLLALVWMTACGNTETAKISSVTTTQQNETVTIDAEQQKQILVSYPEISSEEKDAEKVVAALNKQMQEEMQTFEKQVASEDGRDWEYVAEVCYNQNGMLSIVQSQTLAGTLVERKATTYDLSTGKPMTLGAIMDCSEKEAEALVKQQLGGVIQSDPATFSMDAASYMEDHFDQLQYYRSEEGLCVFFPAGSIAQESAGILEIVIS